MTKKRVPKESEAAPQKPTKIWEHLTPEEVTALQGLGQVFEFSDEDVNVLLSIIKYYKVQKDATAFAQARRQALSNYCPERVKKKMLSLADDIDKIIRQPGIVADHLLSTTALNPDSFLGAQESQYRAGHLLPLSTVQTALLAALGDMAPITPLPKRKKGRPVGSPLLETTEYLSLLWQRTGRTLSYTPRSRFARLVRDVLAVLGITSPKAETLLEELKDSLKK